MVRRGDGLTVYRGENLVNTREQLVQEIEAAFADVDLGGGATLHEAATFEGTDYASAEERARVRALDPETRWQEIPDTKLDQFADRFCFDEEGFRFYLPAFMRWHLRHPAGLGAGRGGALFMSLSVWGHTPNARARSARSLDRFTPEQKRVVARFVEWAALEAADPDLKYQAEEAWSSYWHRFAEPSDGPATSANQR